MALDLYLRVKQQQAGEPAQSGNTHPHLRRPGRQKPGFLEIDLVAHCGESIEGSYLNTLSTVDVATGWVVWDGASSHRGKLMGQAGFARIFLPAYSPELNPAERVFEEVRRRVEGLVYPSLTAKRDAIDHLLRQLKADKTRLKELVSWDWVQQAMVQLPKA